MSRNGRNVSARLILKELRRRGAATSMTLTYGGWQRCIEGLPQIDDRRTQQHVIMPKERPALEQALQWGWTPVEREGNHRQSVRPGLCMDRAYWNKRGV
jgi:hypothetical protein